MLELNVTQLRELLYSNLDLVRKGGLFVYSTTVQSYAKRNSGKKSTGTLHFALIWWHTPELYTNTVLVCEHEQSLIGARQRALLAGNRALGPS